MTTPAAAPDELDRIGARVETWAAAQLAENPSVLAVDRAPEPDLRRWYVRLRGEEKDVTTVWLTIDQRTLKYETYVMPWPEENQAAVFDYLLRRNLGFHGAAFAIGDEDAIYLRGQVPLATVDDDELDRILGSLFTYVEMCFRPALRLGFASRLAAPPG